MKLDQLCAQETLDHLIATVQGRHSYLQSLDNRINELASHPLLADPVAKLRALKGIDTLSAATIAAEAGDFAQFARATSFMNFVGLVPEEHSSGDREWRGSITKTGNAHIRRVLVEAAWAYRHRPAVGAILRRRQQELPPKLVAYSWTAQLRLNTKYRRLVVGKPKPVAITAVARELAGFVWAVMRERY